MTAWENLALSNWIAQTRKLHVHWQCLLGRKAVLTFLNLYSFVRWCVATLDNLA
jgi:hypothetical protein